MYVLALSSSWCQPQPATHHHRLHEGMAQWDALVGAALASLAARRLLFNTRLISLTPPPAPSETFAGPEPWDRDTVEVQIDRNSLQQWLAASQCPAPFLCLLCPCNPALHIKFPLDGATLFFVTGFAG